MSKVKGSSATGWGGKEVGLRPGTEGCPPHLCPCQPGCLAYLIRWVIVLLQVGVSQGFFHCDPFIGVKGQHPVQQVKG